MQSSAQPVLRDIVLIGGGHSHVGVLRSFGMNPLPGVRLTLLSADPHTPYSGMLPGYVAGHYSYDDMHIDLSRLCGFAGARFICAQVIGIDRSASHVVLRDRPPIDYDRLSINIGSTPRLDNVSGAAVHALPVKPISQFNQQWHALLQRVRQHSGKVTIAVVGAGAGGVELLLSMRHRLRTELRALGRDPEQLMFHLFAADANIMPTHSPAVRRRFDAILRARNVQTHRAQPVLEVGAARLRTASGQWVEADEVVWVTRAGGAAWLRATGLALDDEGFVRVDDCLRSVNDARIFAAGDIVSMDTHRLEKAGVFAVRMGRPLAENLRRSVAGQALVRYRPQRRWLALVSTGDKFAIASRGAIGFAGGWVWRWKDWIDRRFMALFNDFPVMRVSPAPVMLPLDADELQQLRDAVAMRCGGCGAKVGASVLSRTIGSLKPILRDDVLIGLNSPDDAAVVRIPPGKALVHTVDFFRAFYDDPYVFGKIAANHALGDIFAMGAQAQTATAVATLPPGLERKVEQLLQQMMAGAIEVLNDAGCALVGGHTGEGSELALGFAVNGLIDDNLGAVMRKSGMRPGDALVLTKPIGTGVLFAAHARMAARGRWVQNALQSMQLSNRLGAQVLRAHGATACTDVTGFGLLGHLAEMAAPSGVAARIELSALPLLEGALECVGAGIVSSLQAANLGLRQALEDPSRIVDDPRYALLFDPQTAGGLLASVPLELVDDCVAALREAGYVHSAVIGQVLSGSDAPARITLMP